MRRMHRIVLLVALVALTPVLAGCAGFDIDKFDIFGLNEKKKLPGERKELFPEGVPGVTQGHSARIPEGQTAAAGYRANAAGVARDDRRRRADRQSRRAAQPSKTAAVEPAEEPKPKPKPKRKPKPRAAKHPVTQGTRSPRPSTNGGQQQPSPWPDQQQAQSPQPAQGQSTSTAPWPSAPPPGTFSR